ncbi:hypothetical protein [Croceicoccus mobilis]|uniref:Uncharacterized protein n=1 Tax=Croceicoccus mobilis TaxID=1703339 RepID=A0A917DUV9_9SPHN|nr:hypothetical protein [Croceicoccus mobilis]GGD71101.1 hypothetical protein GCM10010990_20730 [Croceicoccus mobilis]
MSTALHQSIAAAAALLMALTIWVPTVAPAPAGTMLAVAAAPALA